MTQPNPNTAKEQWPDLDSVADCARYIRTMVTQHRQIFMPGIRDLLDQCRFSEGQKYLMEEHAGAALGRRIEAAIDAEDEHALRDQLEIAFWRPIVSAAALLEECATRQDAGRYERVYAAARLYQVIANNTNNLNLMATSIAGKPGDDPQHHIRGVFNEESQCALYPAMPGAQIVNVLRRGYLRQLNMNIHIEYGLQGEQFSKFLSMVGRHWKEDPAAIQDMPMIRGLNRLRWTRAATIDPDIYAEEMANALSDGRLAIEGPKEP